MADGNAGFLLWSVTVTRQGMFEVTNVSSPTLMRYQSECYLCDWKSVYPSNVQRAARRKGSWLHCSGEPVTLNRADLVACDFASQMCRWMCRLTTGKHIWKAFKSTWTHIDFNMHSLSPRLMKDSVLLDHGAWRSCGQAGISTPRHRNNCTLQTENSSLSLLCPHFWAEVSPQESTVWSGTAGRGRQSSSDKTKSNKVKINSRVAEGRW